MANRNKQKGDRAEIVTRNYVEQKYPGSFRTRAGFNDDLGDIVIEHPAGRIIIQVKDVATPAWKTWYKQLNDQIETAKQESDKPVAGGIVLHKYRGKADPEQWHAVTQLGSFLELIDEAYNAGVEQGIRNMDN